MARVRRLDEFDYYELLGVDRDATSDEIKRAFHAFARRYHPDQHRRDLKLFEKSSRIYRRGTEAYRALSDPRARRAYDEGLAEGRLRFDRGYAASRRPSAPAGGGAARTGRARPFAVKAEQAIRSKDFAQAKLHLQIALQHEPDNAALQERLEHVLAQLRH